MNRLVLVLISCLLLASIAHAEPLVYPMASGQYRVESDPITLDCTGLAAEDRCEVTASIDLYDLPGGLATCPPALGYRVLDGQRDSAVSLQLIGYAPKYVKIQLGDTHVPRRVQTYVVRVYTCAR